MIEKERVQLLNNKAAADRKYVVYWMQASQRVEYNHALEYAVQQANRMDKPVVVFFGLTANYPSASIRHYRFMLEGFRETKAALKERGIKMIIRQVSPEIGITNMASEASLVVVDRGYTRIQKYWRKIASAMIDCRMAQVESDIIVPVEEASPKEEYSAATIRPKINDKLHRFLFPLKKAKVKKESTRLRFDDIFDIDDIDRALAQLPCDRSVPEISRFPGGSSEAHRRLDEFLDKKLKNYPEHKNDPTQDETSMLSPYLHFGQISPLDIALMVMKKRTAGKEAFLEELIIRRELSLNYLHYNNDYDNFEGLPQWCRDTLTKHARDKREYLYDREQLAGGKTHDRYWNAAQLEMVHTGKMSGYMRMYWGKKIIEWTKTPEEAFQIALYLNDKFELDGRDPNGYAGIAWCFGKHDRPWAERTIFGTIRYMNEAGLRRKFDADGYAAKIEKIISENGRQ
jgi:deoxyribodipyrimidine photo-lyase